MLYADEAEGIPVLLPDYQVHMPEQYVGGAARWARVYATSFPVSKRNFNRGAVACAACTSSEDKDSSMWRYRGDVKKLALTGTPIRLHKQGVGWHAGIEDSGVRCNACL